MGQSKNKTTALSETLGDSLESSDMRGMTRFSADKKRKFCRHLARTANIAAACRLVGISRPTAYNHRRKDPEFAALWQEAVEESLDALEAALQTRATEGYERGVWHKGEQVGTERMYSDTAAIFLLKGGRPWKYADRTGGNTSYVDNRRVQIVGLTDEQLQAIAAKAIDSQGDDSRTGGSGGLVDVPSPIGVIGEPED